MKHLVISVSPDSSLALLADFADVILLDKDPVPIIADAFDTLYIRSHFSQPDTLPQKFRNEIEVMVHDAKSKNSDITFIDGMDNVDDIVAFEDKWKQYQAFRDFMPKTLLFGDNVDIPAFRRAVLKKRLSSRGSGTTWSIDDVTSPLDDWIVQESLDIDEEIRVYVVRGNIQPVAAVRDSMTPQQKTQAVASRRLTEQEIEFAAIIAARAPGLDLIGLDIVRTKGGQLYLLEVNRSPGFAAFANLTGVNLANILYTRDQGRKRI